MTRFLALLLLCSVANAQTYYDKTTIPPAIGAQSIGALVTTNPALGSSNVVAAGTGYAPGDTITVAGGTKTTATVLSISETAAVSATVAASGSGGTNGACTVTATTGSGTKAQFTGTVSGNALSGALTVAVAGVYTANPTTPSAEPVTGCNLTGATVNMVLGVLTPWVQRIGAYSVPPANPVSQASTSGSGTGAKFNLSWGLIAAGIASSGLQGVSPLSGGSQYLGFGAGQSVTTGSENAFFGAYAGLDVTTGSFNIAVGHRALGINTTNNSNVAVGADAMRNNDGFGHTIGIGTNAVREWVCSFCVGVGEQALNGKVGGLSTGDSNIAIGFEALYGTGATSAHDNIAIGANTMNDAALTTAQANVCIGNNSCQAFTTLDHATVVGLGSGTALTTGSRNTFIGSGVGPSIQTGINNTAVGYFALNAATDTATLNTVIGTRAGQTITSGTSNTILGYLVGSTTLQTGTQNVLIGTTADIDTAGSADHNVIQIGAGSTCIWCVTGAGVPSASVSTFAGTLTSTGAFTASSTAAFTGRATFNGNATFTTPITVTLGSSLSQASWNLTGIGFSIGNATFNDTTVGSGGVAHETAYSINAPTITNTQGTANVLTNLDTLYLGAPVCGSGWASCTVQSSLYAVGRITGATGFGIAGGISSINVSSNFNTNINTGTSTGTVNIGQNSSSPSSVVIAGPVNFQAGTAFSGASWTTVSPVFNESAMTLNDTTASGTVATEVAHSIQAPTFTSTGGASTTITNATNLYVGAPLCSGGVVCTNLFAINTPGKVNIGAGLTLQGTGNFNVSTGNATNINTGSNNQALTLGGTTAGNIVNIASISTRFGNVLYESATAPTIASGFNTSSQTIIAASTAAFQVTVGTGTGTTTGVVTLPTASNGWACSVADVTTPATNMVQQTAYTTTSVTVTNYVRTTGVAGNFTNSDKLVFVCGAF